MRRFLGPAALLLLCGAPCAETPPTRHLNPDGSPRFTNRLARETSPYLRQHAHNPVDWYPWGDEAFERARKLNRPVFLSIGYSTCHWCHVMEEESFEDLEIARYLNDHYVAIKVDREERPDIDAIYMTAVQAWTGRGGWPLNVWLTPGRRPFYGGTYFPARDGDRGASVGFLTVLQKLQNIYASDPARIQEVTEHITGRIREHLAPEAAKGLPTAPLLDQAARACRDQFDPEWGGAKGAPKFPSSLPYRFLLRQYRRTGDPQFLRMAVLTLEKMAAGGMYDQIGGGFHRYSTDERWLVPHFEKMLYDNALLVFDYLEASQAASRPDLARVARDILRYLERDLLSPEGAFYSATDADSRGPDGKPHEGWFFTWTPAEIEAVLGADRARPVLAYYGVTAKGNFEGRNILFAARPDAPPGLAALRDQLYAARRKRPAPLRDEKILTAWNGLAISAFARAGLILGDDQYTAVAARAASFVLTRLERDGRLLRSWKDGRAQHKAYLEDYAFLTAALLDLFEAAGEPRWLENALRLDAVVERHYEDREAGGFFRTADDHEGLLAREKPAHDGAEPSGSSVAVLNLLRLHALTTRDAYRQRAERALRALGAPLERNPAAFGELLLAVDFWLDAPKELVLVAPTDRSQLEPFLAALRSVYFPNRVLAAAAGSAVARLARLAPVAERKQALKGRATAYVCERGVCDLPVQDPAAFLRRLAQRTSPASAAP